MEPMKERYVHKLTRSPDSLRSLQGTAGTSVSNRRELLTIGDMALIGAILVVATLLIDKILFTICILIVMLFIAIVASLTPLDKCNTKT